MAKNAKTTKAAEAKLAAAGQPAQPAPAPKDLARRQKANARGAKAPPKQPTRLINAQSGHEMRVLDRKDLLFIETHTGDIHIIPKDRVSNLFRRVDERTLKYGDRGFDIAPPDSKDYVTVEEIEELVTPMDPDVRRQAKLAQTEDERRADRLQSQETRDILGQKVQHTARVA